jgi:hypothetical protein
MMARLFWETHDCGLSFYVKLGFVFLSIMANFAGVRLLEASAEQKITQSACA